MITIVFLNHIMLGRKRKSR